jgi:hypothetical protein
MLSAGLDSRAIACASERPLACMTMHTCRASEVSLASRIAQALGYPHHFIQLGESYPLELVTVGSLIGDGMFSFHHAQSWLTRPLVEQHDLSLLLNGYNLDGFFSGEFLPRNNKGGWRRLLPPALPPASTRDPASDFLEKFRTAPEAWLDRVFLDCSAAEVKRGSGQTIAQAAAEMDGYALSKHDVTSWLPQANIAKLNSVLNVSSMGRFADEGIPVYDNELVTAFLALPPAYQFHYRAYGRAIRLLNAEVARIPRSWTCMPMTRTRSEEIVQHYRAGCGTRVAEFRARRCQYRRHDRSAWPRLHVSMSRCPEWHRYLRQRLDASYLVDTGVLNGDGLRRLVEGLITGHHEGVSLVCTWLTLEEWLARYG